MTFCLQLFRNRMEYRCVTYTSKYVQLKISICTSIICVLVSKNTIFFPSFPSGLVSHTTNTTNLHSLTILLTQPVHQPWMVTPAKHIFPGTTKGLKKCHDWLAVPRPEHSWNPAFQFSSMTQQLLCYKPRSWAPLTQSILDFSDLSVLIRSNMEESYYKDVFWIMSSPRNDEAGFGGSLLTPRLSQQP